MTAVGRPHRSLGQAKRRPRVAEEIAVCTLKACFKSAFSRGNAACQTLGEARFQRAEGIGIFDNLGRRFACPRLR